MELDQLGRILAGIAGLLGVVVTVFLAARKATNREAIAHRRASEALSLLKAWEETKLADESPGDLRAKASLRLELLDQALRSTQIYVSSTKPILTTYWASFIFFAYVPISAGIMMFKLEASDLDNPWIQAMVVGVPMAVLFAAVFVSFRVSQHRQDAKSLNVSRKRRSAHIRGKTKSGARQKWNKVMAVFAGKHERIGNGD
ncbi:hypothetical protein SAMN04489740_4136 [Arthrobacter alpinus]|uniref:Uncharacterized protein n=1 Tax=Arthrobacter alpinus TaxID=656366 RepID=A0A1H5PCV9_9MICC|nr:hypothetical protein [Arthrobacter alpinus]SEF11729.1 hypothetical protein SAMN04489740_4136 [Arthrobacter alpinus]